MKHIIIVVFSLLFFVSCGKDQKANTPQKEIKKTNVNVSKKEKTKSKKESVVVVDSDGVANVTITSNDGMRSVKPTLVVMLKEPRAGRVKTRLGRDIGVAAQAHFVQHAGFGRVQIKGQIDRVDPERRGGISLPANRGGLSFTHH